jgi:hypothetical protein
MILSVLVTGSESPAHQEGCPCQATLSHVDLRGRSSSPSESRRRVLLAKMNLEKFENQPRSLTYQIGKNLGSNSGHHQEAEKGSDQLLAKTS